MRIALELTQLIRLFTNCLGNRLRIWLVRVSLHPSWIPSRRSHLLLLVYKLDLKNSLLSKTSLIIKDRLPRFIIFRWRIESSPGKTPFFKHPKMLVQGWIKSKGCASLTAHTLLVHLSRPRSCIIPKFRFLSITRQDSVRKCGLLDHIHFLVNGTLTKTEAMVESKWSGPKATTG